jgi:hypothetical protein
MISGRNTNPPRRYVFSQYTPEMKRDNLSRSVLSDGYHLIRYFDQGRTVDYPVDVDPIRFANHEQRCKTRAPRPFVQLYDLKHDPFELKDIGSEAESTETVVELSRALYAWMKAVEDPLLSGPLRTPYYEKAVADFDSML